MADEILKNEQGEQISLSDLLVAINEIRDICEKTDELSTNYSDEQARHCDQSLSDIVEICRKFPNDALSN